MGKIADATFTGASGEQYSFGAYSLDTAFKDIGAVYIFTNRTVDASGKGTHDFIYIGQAEKLGERISDHEKWPCAKRNHANCICVHVDENKKSRLEKETDLLNLGDTPCND